MGHTQLPIHWASGALPACVKQSGLELSNHRRLVPRLTINGTLCRLAHMPSQGVQKQLYISLCQVTRIPHTIKINYPTSSLVTL